MQLISCHNGRLLKSALAEQYIARPKTFTTNLPALDQLLPHEGFVQGAIHEILSERTHGIPRFFALLLARSAACALNSFEPRRHEDHSPSPRRREGRGLHRDTSRWRPRGEGRNLINQTARRCLGAPAFSPHPGPVPFGEREDGAIVWCDPHNELYPPAIAAMGVSLNHLYLLHPKTMPDQIWALTECLRCKGVAATIAQVEKLSRIDARRLQLAAEAGGGVGILLRRLDRNASIYAAATRWLVAPLRGERTVQRWKIQLIHGHGGRVGQAVILEHHRENSTIKAHPLHPSAELADRPASARASA